jgi:hypothetical protein
VLEMWLFSNVLGSLLYMLGKRNRSRAPVFPLSVPTRTHFERRVADAV